MQVEVVALHQTMGSSEMADLVAEAVAVTRTSQLKVERIISAAAAVVVDLKPTWTELLTQTTPWTTHPLASLEELVVVESWLLDTDLIPPRQP
jgi:hypothetical protein